MKLQPYFRLADRPTEDELQALGVMRLGSGGTSYWKTVNEIETRIEIKAKSTNEKRPLKPGEWYISGAIPEGYRATNGTNDSHLVAVLVAVKRIEYFEEV